ncbi:MAG: leucine-rich repeat domain-containing protein [Alistipes sp.]|nr:leucine-rich repeat domain-containing protein [Alistipes sp.]
MKNKMKTIAKLFIAICSLFMPVFTFAQQEPQKPKIARNTIVYTSADNKIIKSHNADAFNAKIVSNTYQNGQGVIIFDKEITSIGNKAFSYCQSMTSVTIPDSVTEIGHMAFAFCTSLTNITIPDSVTKIGMAVFTGCLNLTTFYGKYASSDNRCLIVNGVLNSFAPAGLTKYTIPNGIAAIGRNVFQYCKNLTSVTIPNSVTKIGDWAFKECSNLTSVTIPNSVTEIGFAAFTECSNLTSVTIPSSITEIGECAFAGCLNLTTFYGKFASSDNRCLIVNGVLHSFAPAGLTKYTIPNGITAIGECAFEECSNLTSVTIPNSVTSIERSAFWGCKNLTSVTIPNSITKIGESTFRSCEKLTSVAIPNSVTEIEDSAFSFSGLISVTIPNSVTKIEKSAFMNCWRLTSVYCKSTTFPSLGEYVFNQNASGRKIYVPRESVESYKQAHGWKDYVNYIVGYDF